MPKFSERIKSLPHYISHFFWWLCHLPSIFIDSIRRKYFERKVRTTDDRTHFEEYVKEKHWPITLVAIIILLMGVFIGVWGGKRSGASLEVLIKDFYANVSSSLVSIAITVLIIDRMYNWRLQRFEKEKVLRQFASRSNDFALDAVRMAGDFGWLRDGSLFNRQLMFANLKGAPLDRAYLRSVNLFGSNLEGANLMHANLQRAFLEGANMAGALLWRANLKEAVLLGTILNKADFWMADLENASLGGADMENACLLQANLKGADVKTANLKNAHYDKFTIWPDNFDPSSSGATFINSDKYGQHPSASFSASGKKSK